MKISKNEKAVLTLPYNPKMLVELVELTGIKIITSHRSFPL